MNAHPALALRQLAARSLPFLSALALVGCPAPIDPPLPPGTPPLGGATTRFMDQRIAEHAADIHLANTPPAISGGTLTIVGPARVTAIVSDPDRDRIIAVDLVSGGVLGETTSLPPGAEPGRVADDPRGMVHVVLRGTGDVYSFDPSNIDGGQRHHVCPMPRGIAYQASTDQLHVACRGGELVTLDAQTGAIARELRVEEDLRDVVVRGETLMVSRFRTAELLRIDSTGRVLGRSEPVPSQPFGFFDRGFEGDDRFGPPGGESALFEPGVAWRTISMPATTSMPAGGIGMVHQRASETEVEVDQPGGYGASPTPCEGSSIVQSSVSVFTDAGAVQQGPNLLFATLPVDLAFSQDGEQLAVVAAANQSGHHGVSLYSTSSLNVPDDCAMPLRTIEAENPVAVAYGAGDMLVVQQREPAALIVVTERGERRIDLGGEPRYDTGHTVFHANSGNFVACASCHPEGGDDGRVWTFGRIGPRRTPAMTGDLLGTEPFHWDGDMADLSHLVRDVFTGRMGGPALVDAEIGALGEWLDMMPAPVASAPTDAEAVRRGASLFYGEANCASCHSGPNFTNSATVDVGTNGAFQVPSLVGVAFRLPVMHDGCADTLEERFEPSCGGGDMHGRTSHLSPAQISDLASFLRTL